MTIQIEEGKWYARDDGSVHGPANLDAKGSAYPWWVGKSCYTEDGLYYADQPVHSCNLVREVPAPASEPTPEWAQKVEAEAAQERPLVLKEGGVYETRGGQMIGPLEPYDDFDAPWQYRNGEKLFYADGRNLFRREDDLIREATPLMDDQSARHVAELNRTEQADIKTTIADEAKRIVSGARRDAYGTPEQNFERIARFWDAYFKNTGRSIDITAADVSPLMRLVKEARLCESPQHYDSFVDLLGYGMTGAEVNGVKKP